MHLLDWLIMFVPLMVIAGVAYYTHRYTRSVADFMSASRCAGRYLVANARGEISAGTITVVGACEYYSSAGFSPTWWTLMTAPVLLFFNIIGFVIVRFRQTRALTLAQFFEMRYSKRFRVFAGALAFASGVINYGIYPAVGARFFVYFCGMPTEVSLGLMSVPTYVIIMAAYLSAALCLVLVGGQLTIMVTDCLEGMMSYVFYLVIICALLMMFSWTQICEAMAAVPAGHSMMNPFDTAQAADFNLWYMLIGLFVGIYSTMAWQGGQGFNSCALNPHEARMGSILGQWRGYSKGVMIVLLAVCAFTYFNHPTYQGRAVPIENVLAAISDPQIRDQMRIPVILGVMLPIAVKGMLASTLLFGILGSDSSCMHSWGSILVQDVILPLRKAALSPEQHLRLLRGGAAFVAVFAFLFSILFRQTEYIMMFMAATGAIYLGGAGAVIIGGLYWKKGTTAGAWCALIVGAVLAFGGMAIQQVPFTKLTVQVTAPNATAVTVNDKPAVRCGERWHAQFDLRKRDAWQSCRVVAFHPEGKTTNTVYYALGNPVGRQPAAPDANQPVLTVAPADRTILPLPATGPGKLFVTCRSINGQVRLFTATIAGILIYIVVSLLTCREDFELDRLLHRGRYAPDKKEDKPAPERSRWSLARILGFTDRFTRGDKAIALSIFGWGLIWALVAAVGTVWNLLYPWPLSRWQSFWKFYAIVFPLIIGVTVTVWYTWGGIRDIRRLFAALRTAKRDARDDGRVVDHHNLDEEPSEKEQK